MNEAICHYSAEKIYDPEKTEEGRTYSGADPDVRNTRLVLKENWECGLSDEEKFILDPQYSLVLVCLGGASPQELDKKELEMVAELAVLLQERTEDSDVFNIQRIKSDASEEVKKQKKPKEQINVSPEKKVYMKGINKFWQNELGIVSPYHAQNANLKEKLIEKMNEKMDKLEKQAGGIIKDCELTKNDKVFRIGTVDAFQGQERDVILVSYGVADVEQALQQDEFIYSYRRLNVALTRARKKAIVFLTSALTDRPIELLNSQNPDLITGVSFLCGLKGYLEKKPSGVQHPGYYIKGTFPPSEKDEGKSDNVTVRIYAHGYRELKDSGEQSIGSAQ